MLLDVNAANLLDHGEPGRWNLATEIGAKLQV